MSDVMEYCDPQRLDILVWPDEAVMERLWRYEEAGRRDHDAVLRRFLPAPGARP